jgi:hypothetical protein
MKRMLVVVVLLVALLAPAVWLVAVGIGKGWPAGQLVLFGGIGLLCGCGLIVLVGGPVFLIWRLTGAPPPRIPLAPGETVLLELPANHWKGLEARRGKLSVTNRRLLFHAHRVNFQRDPLSIELAAVEGARPFALRMQLLVAAAGTTSSFVVRGPSGPQVDVDALAQLIEALAAMPEERRLPAVEAWRNSES